MLVTKENLATIQTVAEIHEHPNADRLVILETSEGWRVCVPNGFYKPGDAIIHVMPDSVLPANPAYSYLANGGNERVYGDHTYYRVRQTKLRGEASQGVVLPLSVLTEFDPAATVDVGTDVSGPLGAMKYEKPAPADGESKGGFPSRLKKTDEDNFQKAGWKHFIGKTAFVTEKYDGSSMTIAILDGEFKVFSRNLEKDAEGQSHFALTCKEYDLEHKLRELHMHLPYKEFAVQGELVGPSIQKNPLGLATLEFRPFNIWIVDDMAYFPQLPGYAHLELCGFNPVPVIAQEYVIPDSAEELRNFAKGDYTEAPGHIREGLVFSFLNQAKGRVATSFKVINPDYED